MPQKQKIVPPPGAASPNPRAPASEVEAALEALETYDNGGKRSALLPLDAAVIGSLGNEPARHKLEKRLVRVLDTARSNPARQYVSGKLALIGTAHSVPALTGLLGQPKVATDARTALEAIPDDAAAKALLGALHHLTGPERAGVISSLGVRRYRPAARLLRRELGSSDPLVRRTAREALRKIEQCGGNVQR